MFYFCFHFQTQELLKFVFKKKNYCVCAVIMETKPCGPVQSVCMCVCACVCVCVRACSLVRAHVCPLALSGTYLKCLCNHEIIYEFGSRII